MANGARVLLVLCIGWLAACCASEREAGADTHTNWLSCKKTSDCANGRVCVDGTCKRVAPTAAEDGGSPRAQLPSTSSTSDPGSAGRVGEEDTSVVADSPTNASVVFELENVVLPEGVAPVVGWQGEHGVVAWVDVMPSHPPWLLRTWVSRTGNSSTHSVPFSLIGAERVALVLADDGRIAATSADARCRFEIYSPDLAGDPATLGVACSDEPGQLAGLAIASTDQWLVASNSSARDAANQYSGTVSATRYAGDSGAAVVSAELGAHRLEEQVAVFAAGADAFVVWGGPAGARLRIGQRWAATRERGEEHTWSDPISLPIASGFSMAPLGARQVLFGTVGGLLSANVIEGGALRRHLELSELANGTVSAAAADSLGIAAVCFGAGPPSPQPPGAERVPDIHAVRLLFVSADGEAIGEPVTIAEGLARPAGCGVAWSGDRFFVVAWGISRAASRAPDAPTSMHGVLIDPAQYL